MTPAVGKGPLSKSRELSDFGPKPPDPNKPWFTWPRGAILLALLVFTFVVAKGCQDTQIKVTQEQAVALAKREVDFKPTLVQVRFLRQGLNRAPFWFVSLSIPIGDDPAPEQFKRLTVVQVDAGRGAVETVSEGDDAVDEDRKAREDAEETPNPEDD